MRQGLEAARPPRRVIGYFGLPLVLLAACLSIGSTYAPGASSPRAQDPVSAVRGRVINGTPGGAVPDDLVVALHIFSGTEERGVFTTTVEAGQTFDFSDHLASSVDVVLEEGQRLVARVVYGGVTYLSDFVTVEAEPRDVSLPITIYETTDSTDEISVAQLHIFVDQLDGRIQVAQYCVIANRGVRTYVGRPRPASDQPVAWSVTLPDHAESLRFETDGTQGRLVALEGGLADTGPIAPAAMGTQASFVYEMAYRDGLAVEQVFDIPVDAVVLVVPGGTVHLEGPGLSPEGTLQTERGPAATYVGGPLDADEPLAFTIVPVDATAVPAAAQSGQVAAGLVVLGAAGAAAYWLWRPSSAGSVPAPARSRVEAIAALDREFERGEIDERRYRQKRVALKRELRAQLSEHRQ